MLHARALILTRDAAKIAVHGRQREGLERPLTAVKAEELQEMPHASPTRSAGTLGRSTILPQVVEEEVDLLLRTGEGLGAAGFEPSVRLEKGTESAQTPRVARIAPARGKAAVRGG